MRGKVGLATVILVLLFGGSVFLNFYQYSKQEIEGEESPEVAQNRREKEERQRQETEDRLEMVERMNSVYFNSQEHFNGNWFGVNTIQNPMDVWITQEIMYEVKPDYIVECGTYKGGSAPIWAAILMHINPNGRVITIDIEDQRTPEALALPLAKERVEFILGSSTDPETVAKVAERVKGKRTMVILDSLHTEEHVAAELAAYSPMVNEGSYIVVQDTAGHLREKPEGWPWKACLDFVANSNGEWTVDRSRERNIISNNIDGYLKRVSGGPEVEAAPPSPAAAENAETSQTANPEPESAGEASAPVE